MICPFKHGKKKKFLNISVLVSEESHLCLKRKLSMDFPENASKQQKGIV